MRLSRLERYVWILVIGVGVLVVEVIGGIISGSLSLLSDSFHVFTDIPATFTTLIAEYLVTKRSFNENRWRGRLGLVSAALLLLAAAGIGYGVYQRWSDEQVIATKEMLSYAILGMIGNGAMWILMAWGEGDTHHHHHKNISHHSLLGHIATDFGQSLAVVLGGFVMMWSQNYILDTWLSVVICGVMVFWSLLIAFESWELISRAK